MAYGKGKGGKGGKVGAGKSKKAPLSRSVRAGLQVRPFSPKCASDVLTMIIVPSWKNPQILETACPTKKQSWCHGRGI